jgi:hypothetical protein
MKTERVVITTNGDVHRSLRSGQRIVTAELGWKWVRLWLPTHKQAIRIARATYDEIRVREA